MMLLLVNAGAGWLMAGISWFVQLVHYPLFAKVGEAEFTEYHEDHSRRTMLLVALPMLVEFGAAGVLVLDRPAAVPLWMVWTGFGCAVLAWGVTTVASVPRHTDLSRGFDRTAWSSLVTSNWLRTIAWSGHALVSFAMIRAFAR